MFVTNVCDGGAIKRTRTYNNRNLQLQVKLGPLQNPVYELVYHCHAEQAFISSVQIVSFVITDVFAAG